MSRHYSHNVSGANTAFFHALSSVPSASHRPRPPLGWSPQSLWGGHGVEGIDTAASLHHHSRPTTSTAQYHSTPQIYTDSHSKSSSSSSHSSSRERPKDVQDRPSEVLAMCVGPREREPDAVRPIRLAVCECCKSVALSSVVSTSICDSISLSAMTVDVVIDDGAKVSSLCELIQGKH